MNTPPLQTSAGWRQRLGAWIDQAAVQNAVLAVIIFNAVTLGLETSPWWMSRYGGVLAWLDKLALAVFIVEIAAKLLAHGRRFFGDAWSVFDFAVVAIALVPGSGSFAILRALRVLRVLRLINRVPSLRFVADAILHAVPGIAAIAGLMLIIFYVSAVIATTLFAARFPEWFGSIGASLYTLFQVMTLESWSMGIVRPVMVVYPWAWAFFVPFILISAFTMLNLFVAVIVDTMSNLRAERRGEGADADALAGGDAAEILAELRVLRTQIAALKQTAGKPNPPVD